MAQCGTQGTLATCSRRSSSVGLKAGASSRMKACTAGRATSHITLAQPTEASSSSLSASLQRQAVLQQWADHKKRRKPRRTLDAAAPVNTPSPNTETASHKHANEADSYVSRQQAAGADWDYSNGFQPAVLPQQQPAAPTSLGNQQQQPIAGPESSALRPDSQLQHSGSAQPQQPSQSAAHGLTSDDDASTPVPLSSTAQQRGTPATAVSAAATDIATMKHPDARPSSASVVLQPGAGKGSTTDRAQSNKPRSKHKAAAIKIKDTKVRQQLPFPARTTSTLATQAAPAARGTQSPPRQVSSHSSGVGQATDSHDGDVPQAATDAAQAGTSTAPEHSQGQQQPRDETNSAGSASTRNMRVQLTSKELLMLRKLCMYRPAGMNDRKAQVSHVLPQGKHALTNALDAAVAEQLLTQFSLQQLCFLAAALGVSQQPCSPAAYRHLCEAALPKLDACVGQLRQLLDEQQQQAATGRTRTAPQLVNHRQVYSTRARAAVQSPSSTPLQEVPSAAPARATGTPTGAKTRQSTRMKSPASNTSSSSTPQASHTPGTALTLYTAGSLVLGLLRMRLTLPSAAISAPGTSAAALVEPAVLQDVSAAVEAAHRVRKLLVLWLQLSLQSKAVTPWSTRRAAQWLSHLAWGLSTLPHHLLALEQHLEPQQQPTNPQAAPAPPAPAAAPTWTPAATCSALPRRVVQTLAGCVLQRKGQLAQMLLGVEALRLACVISCVTPPPARPTQEPVLSHRTTVTGNGSSLGSNSSDSLDESVGTLDDVLFQEQEDWDEVDGFEAAGVWEGGGELGFGGRKVEAVQQDSDTGINGYRRLAQLGFSPAWRLAVRRLVRKVHADVGMMTPEDLAAVVAHVATAGEPLVQEVYAGLVAGARARRVVSLMHRMSKLIRARVHRISVPEHAVLLTCLAVLLRRDIVLQAPVLPDQLLLDEVARWTANKLRNATRPEQVVSVVSSLGAIRWYNPVWWDRVGGTILKLSQSWGGMAVEHVAQVLAAYAAVGCFHFQLLAHFTEFLLLTRPAGSGRMPRVAENDMDESSSPPNSDVVQQAMSPSIAYSVLSSLIRIGYMHVELYDHLAAIMCSTGASGSSQVHAVGGVADSNSVSLHSVCHVAAGCAGLGHVPHVLVERAIEAAAQLGAQALQGTGVGSGSSGGQHAVGLQLRSLGDAAYAVMLAQHPAAATVLAAFTRCLRQQQQVAVAGGKQASGDVLGHSGAGVLLCMAIGAAPAPAPASQPVGLYEQSLEAEQYASYASLMRGYWDARTGPWTSPSRGPQHVQLTAQVADEVVAVLHTVGATDVRRPVGTVSQPTRGVGPSSRRGLGGSQGDSLLGFVRPDISCSLVLKPEDASGDVFVQSGVGHTGKRRHVCVMLSSQKRARIMAPADGVAGSRLSDVLLRVQMLQVVCGPEALIVVVDVDKWLRHDTPARQRALLSQIL